MGSDDNLMYSVNADTDNSANIHKLTDMCVAACDLGILRLSDSTSRSGNGNSTAVWLTECRYSGAIRHWLRALGLLVQVFLLATGPLCHLSCSWY